MRAPLIASLAILLVSSTAALSYSNGCTGKGTIQGGGKIGYSDNAPYGNFSTWTWEVDTGDMSQIAVIDDMLVAGDQSKKVKIPNEGGTVLWKPQVGMTIKPYWCEWDNFVYGTTKQNVVHPKWNGECDSTTLTVVCHGDNGGTKKSSCDPIMKSYLKDHPLQDNQAIYYGWVQTCLSKGGGGSVVTNPDNGKTEYAIDVVPGDAGSYSRDGKQHSRGQSDDLTGNH